MKIKYIFFYIKNILKSIDENTCAIIWNGQVINSIYWANANLVWIYISNSIISTLNASISFITPLTLLIAVYTVSSCKIIIFILRTITIRSIYSIAFTSLTIFRSIDICFTIETALLALNIGCIVKMIIRALT